MCPATSSNPTLLGIFASRRINPDLNEGCGHRATSNFLFLNSKANRKVPAGPLSLPRLSKQSNSSTCFECSSTGFNSGRMMQEITASGMFFLMVANSGVVSTTSPRNAVCKTRILTDYPLRRLFSNSYSLAYLNSTESAVVAAIIKPGKPSRKAVLSSSFLAKAYQGRKAISKTDALFPLS